MVADGAAGGRQRHDDIHDPVIAELDGADHVQLDDGAAQLGVYDSRELLNDLFTCRIHGCSGVLQRKVPNRTRPASESPAPSHCLKRASRPRTWTLPAATERNRLIRPGPKRPSGPGEG